MKLKHVKLTNCLGIEEKEIQVGKVTLIEGASETGKTSIIDSIRKGLKNEDVRPKFVNGDKNGIVFMQFDDDFEVTRTVKPDNKATVKIMQNGMTPAQPQTFLNALLGENDFAPIEWLKKKDKEQTEDLLKLLPIKVASEEIEKLTGEKVKIDFEKHGLVVCEELEKHFMEVRKNVNADVKAYKVNIEDTQSQLPIGYNAEEFRNISLNELFDEISKADKNNSTLEKAKDRIRNSESMVNTYKDNYNQRLSDLENEFKRRKLELENEYQGKVQSEKEKVQSAEKWLEENSYIDTDELRTNAKRIEEGQSYLRMYDKLVDSKKELEKWDAEAERLTNIITEIRKLPSKLLAETKAPIDGMGVENGIVTINGLPIKNLSDGAKMKLAIKVAQATSKDLKLILLNGFEQLNWEMQKELFREMQNDDYQYIITRVSDGPLTISHIENGQLINTETGEMLEL